MWFVAVVRVIAPSGVRERFDWLASGEPAGRLMPVLNRWLAEAPAEIDRAVADSRRKVHETDVVALELDAEGLELANEPGDLGREALRLAFMRERDRVPLAAFGRQCRELARTSSCQTS
jgi:hypothetical protein